MRTQSAIYIAAFCSGWNGALEQMGWAILFGLIGLTLVAIAVAEAKLAKETSDG